jgi:hypothetical protein
VAELWLWLIKRTMWKNNRLLGLHARFDSLFPLIGRLQDMGKDMFLGNVKTSKNVQLLKTKLTRNQRTTLPM